MFLNECDATGLEFFDIFFQTINHQHDRLANNIEKCHKPVKKKRFHDAIIQRKLELMLNKSILISISIENDSLLYR